MEFAQTVNSPPIDPRGGPFFIDADTIERLTPMPELVAAIEAAFRADSFAPTRHAHDLPGGASLLIMPAWREDASGGVKVVTVQPSVRPSIQSTYLLLDGRTGRLNAILDATMLTPRRTAAASALASRYLARADARNLLVIGTGALVTHLVEAHASVRPIEEVRIWGRNSERARIIAQALRDKGYGASPVDDLDVAIAQADIISSATLASRPIIAGKLLRAGTHLDLVGAFKPDMAEADPDCFGRARVFVDSRDGAAEEAGDLLQAIEAGALRATDIAGDLFDLCRGTTAGRRDDREITLFKSVGHSSEDLAAAELVYRQLPH